MIFRGSRYTNTYGVHPYIGEAVEQQKVLFSFRDYLKFKDTDVSYHQYRVGDNFHALAAMYYGNSNYFWVFIEANDISSELDLKAGDLIYVPSLTVIVAYANYRDGA